MNQRQKMTRRSALQIGLLGGLGLILPEFLKLDAAKAEYKAAEAATVDAANEPGRLKVLAGLALVHDALGEDTEANACRAQLA